jgi:hypothetical protein
VGEERRLGEGLGALLATLDIDAHGRVVPQDDAARRALADRAGRFSLLPSAHDLLMARRTPLAGGAPERPRCVFAGDLAAFSIADFVAFIHQSRLSGVLTVSASGGERGVVFKDGEVRGARSDAPGERIGEVALRLGFIAAGQLEEVERAGGAQPFGKALVDRGLVGANDLWKCLHEQVAAVFHAILLSRDGVFVLVDEDAELGTPLAVNTQSLLMDGIRRIDEMTLFRARIPSAGAYVRRAKPKVAITLHAPEQELFDLVDGRRTVAEIAQGAHVNVFDATKILYHLAAAGYVEAVEDPLASPAASPEERLAAIAAGFGGLLRDVAKAVAATGPLDPFLAGVRGFLSDAAGRFAPLWTLVVPGPDGGIEERAVLGNLGALRGAALAHVESSGDAGRFLFDGLRELMFFYLFQANERLSRAADERLALDVKRRFESLGELR